MLVAALAALLMSSAPAADGQTPIPPVQTAIPSADAPTDLDDIIVEGRPLDEQVQTFVREVGAPANDRNLAKWRNGVCVSVVNLRNDAAQALVNRVSDVAREVGLNAGEPGCTPNVMIFAAADAQAFTPELVAHRPRLFRVGGSGMDRGRGALEAFQTTDRPVRWWTVSVPVDEEGQVAVRIPGSCKDPCDTPMTYAPQVRTTASRLLSSTSDDIRRVFIVMDADQISSVNLAQLGDYVAMVALAQINPEADTSGYATVLNLFNDPERTEGLTNWDKAYLQGLYGVVLTRQNRNTARNEVASAIVRVHHRITAMEDAGADE